MDNAINGTVDDTALLNNENNNDNNLDKTNNNSNWIWSDEKLSYYDPSSGWYYREDLGYFYFDENNECHYVYPAETSINNNVQDNNNNESTGNNTIHKHRHKHKREEDNGEIDKTNTKKNNDNEKEENEDSEKKNNDSESESELEEGEISEDDEEDLRNNTNNTYLNQNGIYYGKNNDNSDYYSNYNPMTMEMNMIIPTTTVSSGPTSFSNEVQLAYGIDNNNNIQGGVMATSTTTNTGTTQEYENEYLRLVVQSSDLYDKGSIVLVDTEGLSIGRDKSYEKRLRLPEMQVSKYHAKIYLEIEYQPTTTTTTTIADTNNSATTSLPVENLATLQSKIKPIIPKIKPKKSRIKHKYEDLDNESSEEINYNYDMYNDDMYNEDMYNDDDNDSINSKDKKKDDQKNKSKNIKTDYNEYDDKNTIDNDKIKLSTDNLKKDSISKESNSIINNKIDKTNNIKEEKNSLKDSKTGNDDIKKEEETNKKSSNENEEEEKSEIQNQQNIRDEVEKENEEESEEGEIEKGEEGQIEDIQIDKSKDNIKNKIKKEKEKISNNETDKNNINGKENEEKKKDKEEEEEEEGEITDDGEYEPLEEDKEIVEKDNYEDNYSTNNNTNDAMMNNYYSYPNNYSTVNYEPQPQYTCSYHFSIIDMGSTHGTFVNGIRLSESKICSKPCPLKNKDIIQIGSTILEVHYHKQWACSECTITEHQKEIPLLDKSMTNAAQNSHSHSGYGPNGTASVNGYDPHPVSLEEQRKNELKRLKNKYLPHHRKTKRMKYSHGEGEGEEGDNEEGEDHANPYIDRAAQRRELYSTNIPYFK